MGIYGALSTAVSGLTAQSFALSNISGNIANSQTTAYKRNDTDFLDLVASSSGSNQSSGSVLANAQQTLDISGDVTNVSSPTSMAINGSGFFVVEPKLGENDGRAVFAGSNYFTRRGDFELDKNGYLVNGSGYYLKGLPIDSATGNVSGSVPGVVQVSNAFLPAQGTSRIDYNLNLPQMPETTAYDSAVPGSELIDGTGGSFTDTSGATYDPTTAGTGTVLGKDGETFIQQSIAGGAVTVYADNGTAADMQFRWAKTDSAASGGQDTWNLFYLKNSDAAAGDVMWQNVGQDFTFGSDGRLSSGNTSVTLNGLDVNGSTIGNVDLKFGTAGITQFADPNGSSAVNVLSQNGYAAGKFNSIDINDSGRVVATYSNGQQSELAQIVVADFNAPNKLQKMDGGIYTATSESGNAIVSSDGSRISGGALEGSNTDISNEFTKLIVTQQAYAAGTKIVTTSNDMLQQALNMIR